MLETLPKTNPKGGIVPQENPKFELLKEFRLTIPACIAPEKMLLPPGFIYFFNDTLGLDFNHFRNLVPEKTYLVKIFKKTDIRVTYDECMSALRENEAILVGASGLSLTLALASNELPADNCILSLGPERECWKNELGQKIMPCLLRRSDCKFDFSFAYFDGDAWWGNLCLLCFSELPASQ